MLLNIRFTVIIGLVFFVTSQALADVHSAGDISAGELKSAACAACHGADGNSSNPIQPSLAGQDSGYIIHQLEAFKDGSRKNGMMNAVAAGLSETEMAGLAAFYAGQSTKSSAGSRPLSEKGRAKYQACRGCHGSDGRGQEGYPKLAGQHSEYTVKQLNDFKDGSRDNPAMNDVVKNLSNEDIKALGDYLGSL